MEAWTESRPGINAATQTAAVATYTEFYESLPLALGELLRQRVLRFLRSRNFRLLVLGFLAYGEHALEEAR